jgi:hypothetical protein
LQKVATHSPTAHLYDPSGKKFVTPSNHTARSFELKIDLDNKIGNDDLIPYWVDKDYSYDTSNPRKPNMRELIEALSGEEIEDLYANPSSNWQALSKKASDMLYGVVGGTRDTRDWKKIMSSLDIETTAREQTAELHQPYIDIFSQFERVELLDGTILEVITAQFPVVKNKTDEVLSTNLTSSPSFIAEELDRFGGINISFDSSILRKIAIPRFDFDNLEFIQNYLDGASI